MSIYAFLCLNTFILIVIALTGIIQVITFDEACKDSGKDSLATWLGTYALLTIFESAVSLLDLPRARAWSCKKLRTLLTLLVELSHITWLAFAFVVFNPETKNCIQGNLLMTFMILFIMMIGFLHVIKVIMYTIACLIGWVFDG